VNPWGTVGIPVVLMTTDVIGGQLVSSSVADANP
jgi:hypothetical protein